MLLWVDVERLYQPRKKLHDVNNIYFETQIHFQTPDLKKSQQKTEIKNPKYNQLDKINTQLDRKLRLYLQNLSISNIETILKQTY